LRLGSVVAAVLVACGPPPLPACITDAEGIASGPAAAGAREKAPALWKQASQALDKAHHAHAAGDEEAARTHALEASILYKTALAVARQKNAGMRIAAARDRVAEAGSELERFKSLRIDAQARFLKLQAFHQEQKDLAKATHAAFKKDRDALASMDEEEKAEWLSVERKRIERVLKAAAGAVLAAETLGCDKRLPSETKETREALRKAEEARGAGWETLRPLSDEAWLRAERLLHHARVMHKPDPLENPAEDADLVARFVKAMEDTRVMVSATSRGILLSIRDPLDDASSDLDQEARTALETALGAMGEAEEPVVIIEAYRLEGCSAKECLEDSVSIAQQAASFLVSTGLGESSVISKGWGDSPPSDPGHCLVETCTSGRLDVLIVKM
jgi:hypothetical protein